MKKAENPKKKKGGKLTLVIIVIALAVASCRSSAATTAFYSKNTGCGGTNYLSESGKWLYSP